MDQLVMEQQLDGGVLLLKIQNDELNEEERVTAAELLRLLLLSAGVEEWFYPPESCQRTLRLPADQLAVLREQLLPTLQQNSQPLRIKVCDAAAVIAGCYTQRQLRVYQWPEFQQFARSCWSSPDANMREAGIRMFTSAPDVFRSQPVIEELQRVLLTSLQSTEPYALRAQAAKAMNGFIKLHPLQPAEEEQFRELVLPLMHESIARREDESLMKAFIKLVYPARHVFRPHLRTIFQSFTMVVADKDIELKWRALALKMLAELLVAVPEERLSELTPDAVRLTPHVLDMMCELDDQLDDWPLSDYDADNDKDKIYKAALDSLEGLCLHIDDAVHNLVVALVPEMLASEDWRRRHAAVMALSAVGDCEEVDQVVSTVLNHVTDAHPRVRAAVARAIYVFGIEIHDFGERYNGTAVPGLLVLLDDANPLVQTVAAKAMCELCKTRENVFIPIRAVNAENTHIINHMEPVMEKLGAILTAKYKELTGPNTRLVYETVKAIGSVAETVKSDFVPYYDGVVPCLKYIIANSNTEELQELRGETTQCVGHILTGLAQAEGIERYQEDAIEVMYVLLGQMDERECLSLADLILYWGTFCKILGKRFSQFLPTVMGPLMRAAAVQLEGAIIHKDDFKSIERYLDADTRRQVKSRMRDKGTFPSFMVQVAALETLGCFARELKEDFAEYAAEAARVAVPMLRNPFNRFSPQFAAETVPLLLACAQPEGALQGMNMPPEQPLPRNMVAALGDALLRDNPL